MTSTTSVARAIVASFFAVVVLAACDEGTPTPNEPEPATALDAAAAIGLRIIPGPHLTKEQSATRAVPDRSIGIADGLSASDAGAADSRAAGEMPASAPVAASSDTDGTGGFSWATDYGVHVDMDDDQCYYVEPLDSTNFTFTYYGVERTRAWVSSNGTLTFDGCYQEPDPELPAGDRALVAPLFGDLDPSEGEGVYVNLVGDAPRRRLIVSWVDVPEYRPLSERATFQVQLFEGSNRIQFGYDELSTDGANWDGRVMQVGISSGPDSFIRSAEGSEIPAFEGTNICYTPSGDGGYDDVERACPGPVTVEIAPESARVRQGESVTFEASTSVDGTGDAAAASLDPPSYEWMVNGTIRPGQTEARFTEAFDADAIVSVRVSYDGGLAGSADAAVEVLPNTAPEADIGGPYGGEEGAAIAFDAGGSADAEEDDLSYAWSFGDGATATGAAPGHTYADDGTYTATLVVDDGLAADTAETSVAVDNVAPSVAVRAAGAAGRRHTTVHSGEPFTFTGRFDDPGIHDAPWEYTIDWGDAASTHGSVNDPSAPITGTRTYLRPGTYTVRVTVTDKDGGTGTAAFDVAVTPLPVVMDVKPDSDENVVNVHQGEGVIPVAVLSTRTAAGEPVDFDATEIDATTVTFGPDGAAPAHGDGHEEDAAPYDGDIDMVFHFRATGTGLDCGDTEAGLTGETVSGVVFEATDAVQPNGCESLGPSSAFGGG